MGFFRVCLDATLVSIDAILVIYRPAALESNKHPLVQHLLSSLLLIALEYLFPASRR